MKRNIHNPEQIVKKLKEADKIIATDAAGCKSKRTFKLVLYTAFQSE